MGSLRGFFRKSSDSGASADLANCASCGDEFPDWQKNVCGYDRCAPCEDRRRTVSKRRATRAEMWHFAGLTDREAVDHAYTLGYQSGRYAEQDATSVKLANDYLDHLNTLTPEQTDAWNMGVIDAIGDANAEE